MMQQTQLKPKPMSAQELEQFLSIYRKKPQYYVEDILGSKLWHTQQEIIVSVFANKYTAAKTCNAIGKSYLGARAAVTFLMLYPGSIVVTTAPTWRQVTDVLWREIATTVKMSKVKLTNKEVTQAGLNLDTDWFAVGLSTKRPENFFGYHADNILVIVDEAGGVEEPIFRGVAAITPNINARVLLIGNPTEPSGTFYDAFTKPELGYKTFTVSAFDTPNFTMTGIKTVEDLLELYTPPRGIEQADWTMQVDRELSQKMDPTFTALISPSVVYARYHEWGTDSPAWQALIMGEFPTQAEQALFPTNLVSMAMNMYGVDEPTGKTYAELSGWKIPHGDKGYGQDMARFGSDLNVLTMRDGGWVEPQLVWNRKGEGKLDLMESAQRIIDVIDPYDEEISLNIDDTGNGGGTTDRLRQIVSETYESGDIEAYRFTITPYNFSSKEFFTDADKIKFYDITSLLYWNLRSQFMNKAIALHHDKQLFDELVGRRWGIVGGKIKVESKEDYKKRTGGKSPDKSDSLALAFAPRTIGQYQMQDRESKQQQDPEFEHYHDTLPARPADNYTDDVITAGLMDKRF